MGKISQKIFGIPTGQTSQMAELDFGSSGQSITTKRIKK